MKSEPKNTNGKPTTGLVCMADVQPEPVEWLWNGYFARGKLSIVDGNPGTGKSHFTLDISARVSNGGPMPDGTVCGGGAGGVLLLTAEDGLSDTVASRLSALHADQNNIHAVSHDSNADGQFQLLSLPNDLPKLEQWIRTNNVHLVVIDPLFAFLAPGINSWSDQDVRRALAPLAQLAEATNTVILLVRHLNKKEDLSALNRGGGSVGIIASVRTAFLIAPHPDGSDRRVLAQIKNNLARIQPSLVFEISSADHCGSAIKWLGSEAITGEELIRRQPKESKFQKAMALITDVLETKGSITSTELLKIAEDAGISASTLKRASKDLGLERFRQGFGKDGCWRVRLPREEPDHKNDLVPFEESDDQRARECLDSFGETSENYREPEFEYSWEYLESREYLNFVEQDQMESYEH